MIRVEDLVHRYGDTVAVDGVDLTIDDGECVILAGANGSGKTTLVRHFNGLLEPDEGTVVVNGSRVSEHLVAARTSVAMVFQHPEDQLVAATVGADVAFGPENLGLDRDEIDRRVSESLAAVNFAGREDERVDSLSGGEVERLAIAGALAMRPDHLVLDEPFTGLDEPARWSVLARLRELREAGTSLVIVTHDLRDVASLADRVVVLSGGRIALDEDPDSAADKLPDLDVRPPC
ncbi:ABC transporter ATP-binding protein [Haloferax mediterranei ATCC 33500]|uniref:ABC transporter ATP-binding protein n=1 Tax=Haloferax mediterranei (strain ATCC 33500 / DSM 1411 / JCM 8866 / NBRC 14739 / NCIMB 2177 / R-4) TaxID=523841 RepID=I3R152_HALMT|nr:ABC transporter ATP-binding protein [Haloferax mediterranei]AFK17962.1 cobalt ABC transporter ATP-binding protein [Haloferax mediterranei ATCC 33500]AHZ22616.1 ABC transporter ATP-binding protein [Haloferax mediterranei ATCC 33500]EMA02760.1 cobalt ABC transporter ATP-binding protein [Haloferax mediterranei ATCC 33500]MDX5988055.1 ABC transporter ATP-binding protein [Haloferax mediterranei ATCC 33500]QCQ74514.1 ABC transporter ATP-binding protein [Haloferax mediterranei ATCC 33500]